MSAQRPAGFRLFPTARAFPTTASSNPDMRPANGFRLLISTAPYDTIYRNSTGFEVEIVGHPYIYIDEEPEKFLHRPKDFFKGNKNKTSAGLEPTNAVLQFRRKIITFAHSKSKGNGCKHHSNDFFSYRIAAKRMDKNYR